jgi:hypothetical protein
MDGKQDTFSWIHAFEKESLDSKLHVLRADLNNLTPENHFAATWSYSAERSTPKPHPEDVSWTTFFRSLFFSPWFRHKAGEKESLRKYCDRLLATDDPVAQDLTPTRDQLKGVTTALLIAVRTCADLAVSAHTHLTELWKVRAERDALSHQITRLREDLDLSVRQHKILAQEQSDLIKELRGVAVAAGVSLQTAINERDSWIEAARDCSLNPDRTDSISPDILRNVVNRLRSSDSHNEELVYSTQQILFEWENIGLLLCPNDRDIPPQPAEFRQAVLDLIRLGKMASSAAAGSSKANRLTILFDEHTTIDNFWEGIPSVYTAGKKKPNTPDELKQFIIDTLTNAPAGLSSGCDHPRDLAVALEEDEDQDWEDSRQHVSDMVYDLRVLRSLGRGVSTVPSPSSKLPFKATEVPVLKDLAAYEEWRSRATRFLGIQEVQPSQYATALLLVLTTFEDKTADQAAMAWDPANCVKGTWDATLKAFFAVLDQNFGSVTIYEDTVKEFMKVRPTPGESATSFFNRFDAVINKRHAVEERLGITKMTEADMVARLLNVAPRHLTNFVRAMLRMRENPARLESLSPAQLRPLYENAWAYAPGAPAAPPRQDQKRSGPAARSTPAGPSGQDNQTRQRQCGLVVSYDSTPAVPASLRGRLYPSPKATSDENAASSRRLDEAVRQQVCEYCRRPRSQHQTVGAVFKPVTRRLPASGSARPSPVSDSQRVTDVTDEKEYSSVHHADPALAVMAPPKGNNISPPY